MIDVTFKAVVDKSRDKNESVRLRSKTMSDISQEDKLTPIQSRIFVLAVDMSESL